MRSNRFRCSHRCWLPKRLSRGPKKAFLGLHRIIFWVKISLNLSTDSPRRVPKTLYFAPLRVWATAVRMSGTARLAMRRKGIAGELVAKPGAARNWGKRARIRGEPVARDATEAKESTSSTERCYTGHRGSGKHICQIPPGFGRANRSSGRPGSQAVSSFAGKSETGLQDLFGLECIVE